MITGVNIFQFESWTEKKKAIQGIMREINEI